MSERKCSVLFLGNKRDGHVEKALKFCQLNFTDVTAYLGKWGDSLPVDIGWWDGGVYHQLLVSVGSGMDL